MEWLYSNWLSLGLVVVIVTAMLLFVRSRAVRAVTGGGCCCGSMDEKPHAGVKPQGHD